MYPYPPYGQPWQMPWQAPSWPMQSAQQLQNVRFVKGLEGAKSCATPIGARILLMDEDNDRFYIRETDTSGVATIAEYEFRKVEPAPQREYVTKQDLEQFASGLLAQMKERQNEPTAQPQPRIDPAAIPVIPNVAGNAVPQNDYTAAGQVAGGAAYQATGYDAAGIR